MGYSKLKDQPVGLNKYLMLNLKLCQMYCPLLMVYDIEPFLFCNLALAPNRNQDTQTGSWLKRHLRFSTGVGLSLQLSGLAIECHYNLLVNKMKGEIGNELQINIGID